MSKLKSTKKSIQSVVKKSSKTKAKKVVSKKPTKKKAVVKKPPAKKKATPKKIASKKKAPPNAAKLAAKSIQPASKRKFRLITRSDFDGLVCALLLMHLEILNDVTFVHPKDMQDGKVKVTDNDISTNLPYAEGIHLAFDHHESETIRVGHKSNHIIDPRAPSAARVVYDYYGGKSSFPDISDELMAAVDKADSAQFTRGDVANPQGWELLSFLMDARTGLGRFKNFRISNYQLMIDLTLQSGAYTIEQILAMPDVKERVELYQQYQSAAKKQIQENATVQGDVIVLDLRRQEMIYPTNRFTIYDLFPQCNVSIHVMQGKQNENTVLAIGKSIFKRDSSVNIGDLCLQYGGGGHQAAGTCQVSNDKADAVLAELVGKINRKV